MFKNVKVKSNDDQECLPLIFRERKGNNVTESRCFYHFKNAERTQRGIRKSSSLWRWKILRSCWVLSPFHYVAPFHVLG